MCGVVVDEEGEESFKSIGVKDSKLLTKKQREILFEKIKKIVKEYELVVIQPAEVDLAVDGAGAKNLNFLEAAKIIDILRKLEPDRAYIDCPSPNIRAYKEYIQDLLKNKTELIVAHKADVKYPVVSAASILAKVTRDREIEKLERKYGKIGSGYPADPITKKFLKENFNRHPEIFRHSWSTMKELKNGKGQSKLGDF